MAQIGSLLDTFLSLLYFVFFLFLISRLRFFRLSGFSRVGIGVVFALKVLAGFVLTWIYTYHYTNRADADIFKYFDDSLVLFDALFTAPGDFVQLMLGIGLDEPRFTSLYLDQMNSWLREFEDPVFNDAHTIIRLNVLIRFFSFGYFGVHTVFMSFISLVGLVGIYRALFPFFRDRAAGLASLVFLIPSVLFWGSGALKEGLLFFGLGMLLSGYFATLRSGFSASRTTAFVIGIATLLFLKFYILIALIPGSIAFALARKQDARLTWIIYGATLVLIGFGGLHIHLLFPDFHVPEILARKQQDFVNLAHARSSGSYFELTPLEPSLWGLIQLSPEALFNAIFRPFPGETTAPLALIASVENCLILLAAVFLLWKKAARETISLNLLLYLASYILILYLLIGWVTPVTGALVRYKVPVLPFYLLFFLALTDPNKLPAPFRIPHKLRVFFPVVR